MADIRTILKGLAESDPDADRLAKNIIANYPGAHVRWKNGDGSQFSGQIAHMATWISQFSQAYTDKADAISARIIDTYRVKNGQPPMLLSLALKTPPKAEPVDLYKGPQPWAKLMIESEERGYDNEAENTYLVAINDRLLHESIRERLRLTLNRDFTLQDLSVIIANELREDKVTQSLWIGLNPVQRAYTIRAVLNHFISELTNGGVDVLTLLQWAIEEDPKLLGFIPLGCCDTLRARLKFPAPINLTKPPTTMAMTESHYIHTPIARPTLVYGEDIDLMDDEELIDATKAIQKRIDTLRAIPGNSRKIAKQIKEAEEAMALVVAKLDEDLPSE